MFPLVEIEMEGLLILERSNKAKPNLLLTVVFLEKWHGNLLLAAVVMLLAGGRELLY